MNKSLLATVLPLALPLALPTAVSADVTLYGKANVSLQSTDESGSSTTEVVSNASRIGVKGSETLSEELKAIYKFEFEVHLDDGDNDGDTFSQRNIYVGLQSNKMGTVIVGKFDTPLKVAQNKIDLFNDFESICALLKNLDFNKGDLTMVFAMISWATYSALLKKKKYELTQISLLQVVITFGLIFLIPIYFIEMKMGYLIKLEKPFYLTLTYVVLFPGLASFFFWIKGIAIIGANRAGIFLHLMPIFGAVMAMIIFVLYVQMVRFSAWEAMPWAN